MGELEVPHLIRMVREHVNRLRGKVTPGECVCVCVCVCGWVGVGVGVDGGGCG